MDASVIVERGLVVVVVICGVVCCWASAAGVDIVAMLTVCALCVCVSNVTRAYGQIVTGCSVGGVSPNLLFGYLVPPPILGKAEAFPYGVNFPG